MPKNSTLLFLLWNIALTGLIAWGLLRKPTTHVDAPASQDSSAVAPAVMMATRDSAALKEARIAYFHMDSVKNRYELIAEKNSRFTNEADRIERNLQKKQDEARQRYQELMTKDHTYSTKAEVERDENELREQMARLQELQADGEQRMARMEAEMLTEISKELEAYLEEYNKTAGFDYILSIQGGGQIWVGNKGLDITNDLVSGLNARHRARKTTQ
ncbi:MAG: OmpH family outer membrane protein [Flavobacteriales bacterium]|nr:OmpH family outer membrane protein [Flavobacteriales bacterium]